METPGLIAKSLSALPGSTGQEIPPNSRLVGSLLSVTAERGKEAEAERASSPSFPPQF